LYKIFSIHENYAKIEGRKKSSYFPERTVTHKQYWPFCREFILMRGQKLRRCRNFSGYTSRMTAARHKKEDLH